MFFPTDPCPRPVSFSGVQDARARHRLPRKFPRAEGSTAAIRPGRGAGGACQARGRAVAGRETRGVIFRLGRMRPLFSKSHKIKFFPKINKYDKYEAIFDANRNPFKKHANPFKKHANRAERHENGAEKRRQATGKTHRNPLPQNTKTYSKTPNPLPKRTKTAWTTQGIPHGEKNRNPLKKTRKFHAKNTLQKNQKRRQRPAKRGNPTRPTARRLKKRTMPRAFYAPFRQFQQAVRRDTVPLTCSQCGETLRSKDYENHCKDQHARNPRRECVWCEGDYTWEAAHKHEHVDHLLACWRRAKAQREVPPEPQIEPAEDGPTTPFNWTPLCPAGDWFGHHLPPGMDARYYTEPIALFPLPPPRMAWRTEALNDAAAALELHGTEPYDWHHLMIRAVVLPKFWAAMQRHAHTVGTLPFFCMCDGGKEPDPYYRHHRHMIVVSRVKDYLKEVVLREVTLAKKDRPPRKYRIYETDDIQDPMHLLNTMGYVSKRPSRCQFSVVKGQQVAKKLNHFLCYRALPEDYRLALAVVWDGGVMDVVELLGRKLTKAQLTPLPMELHQARYRIRVHHMPSVRLTVPLPFGAPFQRTHRPTRWWLYLVPGERTYFEFEDDPDPVYGFYEVRHQWWVPSQRQQNWLADRKPLYDENQAMKAELFRLRVVAATLSWWKEKGAEKEEVIEQLTREKEQCQHRLAEREEAIAEWSREKEQWKQKLAEKDETIEALTREMKHLKMRGGNLQKTDHRHP